MSCPVSEAVTEALERFNSADVLEAKRLFHGRGMCYPGFEQLVVNWFPPYLQVVTYDVGLRSSDRQSITTLFDEVQIAEGLVLQTRQGRKISNEILFGEVPGEHVTNELGQKYWVKLLDNQNVGLFLDMGHVRRWLAPKVKNRKVLNLFAYTCVFSVSALVNGARSVVNVDMSKNAIEWGKENHKLNDLDLRMTSMLSSNVFRSWRKIKQLGRYGVIIIDPPTNQRGSFNAEKHYGQILKRLPDFAERGATIVACLNSPFLGSDFIVNQMARWCPACRFNELLNAHPDFPDLYPERGLKVLSFTYEG